MQWTVDVGRPIAFADLRRLLPKGERSLGRAFGQWSRRDRTSTIRIGMDADRPGNNHTRKGALSRPHHMQNLEQQPVMRILIIEDDPTIALDFQDLLEDAGFDVVGVAGKLDMAMELIASTPIDAAIVDANLGGVSSSAAAVALAERRVPFIVLSGYSLKQLDAAFPGAPFIQKPCRPEQLINALKALRLQQ